MFSRKNGKVEELQKEIEGLRAEFAALNTRSSQQSMLAIETERKLLLRCQELMEERSDFKDKLAARENDFANELKNHLRELSAKDTEILHLKSKIEEMKSSTTAAVPVPVALEGSEASQPKPTESAPAPTAAPTAAAPSALAAQVVSVPPIVEVAPLPAAAISTSEGSVTTESISSNEKVIPSVPMESAAGTDEMITALKADLEKAKKDLADTLAAHAEEALGTESKLKEFSSCKGELSKALLLVASLQHELEQHKKEEDRVASQYRSASESLNIAEESLEQAENKIKEQEKLYNALKNECTTATLQYKASQTELLRVSSELTSIKNKDLWEAIDGGQEKVREREAEVSTEKLQIELASKDAALAKFKNVFGAELFRIKDDFTVLFAKLDRYKRELDSCQKERDNLVSDYKTASLTIETMDEAADEQEKKIQGLEKAAKQLQDERDTYSLQLRACQQELRVLGQEVSNYHGKNIWAAMEDDSLTNQAVAKIQADLDEALEQKQGLSDELRVLKKDYGDAVVSIADVHYRLRKMTREKDNAEEDRRNAETTMQVSEDNYDEAEKKLAVMDKNLKKVTKERDNLSLQLRATQTELVSARKDLSNFVQKELWMAIEGEQEIARESSALRVELNEREDELRLLRHEYNSSTYRIAELEKELRECKRDLERAVSDYHSSSEAFSESVENVEQLEGRLKDATTQLKSLQTEKELLQLLLRAEQQQLQQASTELSNYKQKSLWEALDEDQLKLKQDSETVQELEQSRETVSRLVGELSHLKGDLSGLLSKLGAITS